MEKYESKHQQILRSAEQIYTVISRFDNLTPAVQDKVEEWQADENSCSFKVKGFTVNLQIVAKEAPKYVKIQSGEGGVPIDFTFWIQLQPAGPYDRTLCCGGCTFLCCCASSGCSEMGFPEFQSRCAIL